MKKTITIVFALCLFAVAGNSQNNAVKFNPFGLLFGNINLGYEHVLNENSSIEFGASYARFDATVDSEEGVTITGFGVYGMYRMYIGKKAAPRGIYLSPNISYNNTSGNAGSGEEGSVKLLVAGLMFGNQWVWGENGGFLLDIGIGTAYYDSEISANVTSVSLDGIGPQLRVAIGYAF